jgi:hypothetical protein
MNENPGGTYVLAMWCKGMGCVSCGVGRAWWLAVVTFQRAALEVDRAWRFERPGNAFPWLLLPHTTHRNGSTRTSCRHMDAFSYA